MENTTPKKKHTFLKVLAVIAAVLLLLFAILRATHVIVRVGKKYRTRFGTIVHINHEEENKDVSEMIYMKRVYGLDIISPNVTDFSFITELPNLEILILHSPGNEHFAETLPSLKNSPGLYYLVLYADLESLDIIAENPELENIIISEYSTVIKDISGLRNKPKLKYVDLSRIECSDLSALFDLTELKNLHLSRMTIPDDIKDVLTLKNSAGLETLYVGGNIEDLDLIAENPELTQIEIIAYPTAISDISGLRNKPKLERLSLNNVNCSDLSVLLALPKLKSLELYGTIIPDDIMDKLIERGVEIENMTTEEYEKKREEAISQAEEKQKTLKEENEELLKAYEQRPEVKQWKREKRIGTAGAILLPILAILLFLWIFRQSKKNAE